MPDGFAASLLSLTSLGIVAERSPSFDQLPVSSSTTDRPPPGEGDAPFAPLTRRRAVGGDNESVSLVERELRSRLPFALPGVFGG